MDNWKQQCKAFNKVLQAASNFDPTNPSTRNSFIDASYSWKQTLPHEYAKKVNINIPCTFSSPKTNIKEIEHYRDEGFIEGVLASHFFGDLFK